MGTAGKSSDFTRGRSRRDFEMCQNRSLPRRIHSSLLGACRVGLSAVHRCTRALAACVVLSGSSSQCCCSTAGLLQHYPMRLRRVAMTDHFGELTRRCKPLMTGHEASRQDCVLTDEL